MRPIFTGLAPNTQWDDAWLAFKLLLQPWRWKQGKAIKKLEQQFCEYLSVKHALTFSSGRACLYAILSSLNLAPDDEVLLQAYTCVAVPGPIIWAGAKPVYVDCEKHTFNMSPADLEKKITPKSKVIIIQHTFGLPADINALLAIAKKHNLFVIEDCAHALGAKYNGKYVGTFGDAAFFSLGRDKVISSVFGGVAVTNSKKFSSKLEKIRNDFSYSSKLWIWRQLIHPITFTKLRTLYYVSFYLGKIAHTLIQILNITSKAVSKKEKQGGRPVFYNKKMPNALALLALHQFKKLEQFNKHRRKIARLYNSYLHNAPQPPLTLRGGDQTVPPLRVRGGEEGLQNGHIYMRYTIFNPRAQEIIFKLQKKKIFLGDWYQQGIAPEKVNYQTVNYNSESCPVAEELAKQSLNLPTDIHINEKDAQRIVYEYTNN